MTMAKKQRGHFLEFDCAAAVLTGTLQPHRSKEGQWVLQTEKLTFPVEVHPPLQEQLVTNPDVLQKNPQLACWVRWNWEKSCPQLTVVKGMPKQPNHRDHYTVRGTVASIENNVVLIRIQPSREEVEPFEVPVLLRPEWLEKIAVGQRLQTVCAPKQGWLHVRSWYVVRPRQSSSSESSALPEAS